MSVEDDGIGIAEKDLKRSGKDFTESTNPAAEKAQDLDLPW